MSNFLLRSVLVFASLLPVSTSYAWYGKTHKWLAQEAASYLPEEERIFFETYRNNFFQGSVNADRFSVEHHIYFEQKNMRRNVVDNSAAYFAETRALEAIDLIHRARMRGEITEEDKQAFAEKCGQAIHPVCDMHAPHTVPDEDRRIHIEIELEVNMDVREGERFESPEYGLKFDRKLRDIDPYTAAVEVAKLAHYGSSTILPAEELLGRIPMGEGEGAFVGSEEWDAEVDRSVRKILEKEVNVSAEVLHWIYRRAFIDPIRIAH